MEARKASFGGVFERKRERSPGKHCGHHTCPCFPFLRVSIPSVPLQEISSFCACSSRYLTVHSVLALCDALTTPHHTHNCFQSPPPVHSASLFSSFPCSPIYLLIFQLLLDHTNLTFLLCTPVPPFTADKSRSISTAKRGSRRGSRTSSDGGTQCPVCVCVYVCVRACEERESIRIKIASRISITYCSPYMHLFLPFFPFFPPAHFTHCSTAPHLSLCIFPSSLTSLSPFLNSPLLSLPRLHPPSSSFPLFSIPLPPSW